MTWFQFTATTRINFSWPKITFCKLYIDRNHFSFKNESFPRRLLNLFASLLNFIGKGPFMDSVPDPFSIPVLSFPLQTFEKSDNKRVTKEKLSL